MDKLISILAATDFSVDGDNAVRRAALLAREHGARLHILHVVNPAARRGLRQWFAPMTDVDLKAAQAQVALRRLAVEVAAEHDVRATVEVAVGDPTAVLQRAATDSQLVVTGASDRIVRNCRRPVLVVKKSADARYRRVLLPIDFTPGSDAAVALAARWLRGADMHVFHAADTHLEAKLRRYDVAPHVVLDVRAREIADAAQRMRRTVDRLGLGGGPLSMSVGRGPADTATLQRAEMLRADLIVVGQRGRSMLGGLLFGSVSRQVLSGARCDLLVVPAVRRHEATQVAQAVPRLSAAASARL